jgi:hypothetical protein
MKYIISIVLFLTCLTGFSQTKRELLNNFIKGENNIIYWQKVVETDLSHAEMLDAVLESGFYKDIEVAGNKLICSLKPYKLNYEQYGYTVLETSTYLTQNLITGTVIFELGNHRYRATVKNIEFIQNSEQATGYLTTLEYHVLNRFQELRLSYFRNASDLLDKDFSSKTRLRVNNDEW